MFLLNAAEMCLEDEGEAYVQYKYMNLLYIYICRAGVDGLSCSGD